MSSAFNPMHLGALFGSHFAVEGSTLGYEGLGVLESAIREIVNHAMASSSLTAGGDRGSRAQQDLAEEAGTDDS